MSVQAKILLSKEQRIQAAEKIKTYLERDLDIQISRFQAELFVDNITEQVGIYYYNQAIMDSLDFMNEKMEDLYLLIKDEDVP